MTQMWESRWDNIQERPQLTELENLKIHLVWMDFTVFYYKNIVEVDTSIGSTWMW